MGDGLERQRPLKPHTMACHQGRTASDLFVPRLFGQQRIRGCNEFGGLWQGGPGAQESQRQTQRQGDTQAGFRKTLAQPRERLQVCARGGLETDHFTDRSARMGWSA